MTKNDALSLEINKMRRLLERTVHQHKYNFRHPKVLEVSQQLDSLIVLMMKLGR